MVGRPGLGALKELPPLLRRAGEYDLRLEWERYTESLSLAIRVYGYSLSGWRERLQRPDARPGRAVIALPVRQPAGSPTQYVSRSAQTGVHRSCSCLSG